VPDRRGVGDRAVYALCVRLIGEWIAVLAEQRAPRRDLHPVARSLNISDGKARLAPSEPDGRDHAIAREDGAAVLHEGREGRVRHGPEEDALDVRGDAALDGE